MAARRRRDYLLVVQGTPFCNIDCRYCYLPGRLGSGKMRPETFERLIANVVAGGVFPGNFTVCWHAGEPLVMPVDFYETCIGITERYQTAELRIRHTVQTNLTLLDERWCDFFKRHASFHVGVSCDGPAELHDLNRIDRSGRGTSERVERGMAMLRSAEIPFSIICVLTREHLRHARDLHAFFETCGATAVSFNIEELDGVHLESSLNAGGVDEEFRRFIRELLDLNDESGTSVNYQRVKHELLAEPEGPPISDLVTPWSTVTVDYLGNASTFSPELMGTVEPRFENFVFGNLAEQRFDEVRQAPAFLALHDEIVRGVDRCRTECEYFTYCGGGAPSNKYFEHGRFDVTETLECRLMKKAVLDVNLERLEDQLAAIAAG